MFCLSFILVKLAEFHFDTLKTEQQVWPMSAIAHNATSALSRRHLESNMAERIRNPAWENDEDLRKDLEKYVRQNLRRNEMLDFVQLNYPMYAWSLRSLCRRLQFFDLKFTD